MLKTSLHPSFSLWFIMLVGLFASSCSISRRVPDGMYLLDRVKVEIEEERSANRVQESDLNPYIRQKTNKKILGFRFHLRLYNMAKPHKYTGLSRWLKTVGEEPMILDTFLTERSSENINRYLRTKGFYHAMVGDTTLFYRKNRAMVKYTVTPNRPHVVRQVSYSIEDTVVRSIVLADTMNTQLKSGVRFDLDLLNGERRRIESLLREEGYYFFSRDFVRFNADSSIEGRRVDLTLTIPNRSRRNPFGDRIVDNFRRYEIGDVYLYPSYNPSRFSQYQRLNILDTLNYQGLNFVYADDIGVQPSVLSRANYIRSGDLFSESMVRRTRGNFNSLRLYRMVNIFFEEEKDSTVVGTPQFDFFSTDFETGEVLPGRLTCHIQLAPHSLQSYQVDMVGTTSSQEYGIEGNLNYQHRNIFRGAEILDVRLKTELKAIQLTEGGWGNAMEYGAIVGVTIPRYLNPLSGKEFIDKYNPRTMVNTHYNFSKRPDYTRTIAGMNFGYIWRNDAFLTHSVIPADVSVINLLSITEEFRNEIAGTYRENSYTNQIVTTSGYGLIFNNQNIQRATSYTYLRLNTELSGNALSLVHPLFAGEADDGTRRIFGTTFSQFVRGDVNYVYNHVVDPINTFVYRVYLGLGFPYGNSYALPFEKKYFTGGSSGIRAWQARRLGPGTYVDEESRVANQSADIKFEANIEYRFQLFWMLEGALFLDAGNIWAITAADERPGAVFRANSFYKQIALGTGTGLRVNFGFFTFRLDLGVKLHDPGIRTLQDDNGEVANYHWIPFQRPYSFRDDFVLHFGIGYPF